MFEVKTTNGSRVRPKIAGTESTAKTMSVISRKRSAMISGVAWSRPSCITKKLWPWKCLVTGKRRRNARITQRSWGSTGASSPPVIILAPVKTRKAPKIQTTHSNCRSAAPSAMKMPRETSAPRIPKNSTRCW